MRLSMPIDRDASMRSRAARCIATVATVLALISPALARATPDFEDQRILRVDGSELLLQIAKSDTAEKIPLLLVIDGSLCTPSLLSSQADLLADPSGGRYATLLVEKPDVTMPEIDADGGISIGPDFTCSDGFRQRYTIDQRVLDHLRALQYLRTHADWWNGELVIWGFSDGGRIASRVGAFTAGTRGMVLGGFGGGRPMAVDFEDVHICAPDRTENRDSCLRDLRAQFDAMRHDPTPSRTWNGSANSWATWASRLDAVEAHLLADVRFPVLAFHGVDDASTPVASARMLAEQLRDAPHFRYREIAGMGHGLGSGLSPHDGDALRTEFLDWLISTLAKPDATASSNMDTRSE